MRRSRSGQQRKHIGASFAVVKRHRNLLLVPFTGGPFHNGNPFDREGTGPIHEIPRPPKEIYEDVIFDQWRYHKQPEVSYRHVEPDPALSESDRCRRMQEYWWLRQQWAMEEEQMEVEALQRELEALAAERRNAAELRRALEAKAGGAHRPEEAQFRATERPKWRTPAAPVYDDGLGQTVPVWNWYENERTWIFQDPQPQQARPRPQARGHDPGCTNTLQNGGLRRPRSSPAQRRPRSAQGRPPPGAGVPAGPPKMQPMRPGARVPRHWTALAESSQGPATGPVVQPQPPQPPQGRGQEPICTRVPVAVPEKPTEEPPAEEPICTRVPVAVPEKPEEPPAEKAEKPAEEPTAEDSADKPAEDLPVQDSANPLWYLSVLEMPAEQPPVTVAEEEAAEKPPAEDAAKKPAEEPPTEVSDPSAAKEA